jgi:hypothetical protein
LFNKTLTTLIQYPAGKKEGRYAIPAGVTNIGDFAFEGCIGLASVSIPAGVTGIGQGPFSGCTGLADIAVEPRNERYASRGGVLFNKTLTILIQYPAGKKEDRYAIPAGVTSIGDWAFSGCTGLSSVSIPAGVTSIGNGAFSACTGFSSVSIPAGVTSIGNSAFSGCTGLSSVSIPAGVTNVGNGAFEDCTGFGEYFSRNIKSAGEYTRRGEEWTVQTALRAYYVRSNGNDGNNGRSKDAPLKTLTKAAEMANRGAVKIIIIIGTLNRATEGTNPDGQVFKIENTGTVEIVVTGIPDASDEEKASLRGDGNNSVLHITGKGPVRLENMDISGGNAFYGGGIYIDGAAVTLGEGVVISGNRAGERRNFGYGYGKGGGVYLNSGTLTMLNNATIINNTASGGTLDDGGGVGGGVCIERGNFIMSGGTISGNTASGDGGGVRVDFNISTGGFTMFDGEIVYNTANVDGGGISSSGGSVEIKGGSITNNTAKRRGGGVWANNNVTVTMSGGIIGRNTALGNHGGGVWGNVAMSNGTISGNTAKVSGGGVYGSVTMTAGVITGNTAQTGSGGGIWGNKIEIKGGSIINNTAKMYGGGVHIGSSASVISGGEIIGNKAEYGGGVYMGGNLTMSDGEITGNGAEFVGGGIYVESGKTFTQGSGTVTGNTAGDGDGEDVFRQ